MKKIDAHAHLIGNICGIGSEGELRPLGNGMVEYATGRTFRLIPEGFGDKELTPETLLSVMDANEVEYSVCLQGNYAGFQNLYTYDAMKNYPKRILGAATLDPFFRKADMVYHHLFDDLGFKVIKMEVSNGSGLMANHPTVDLDGEIMHSIYSKSNERNLLFYIDIGRPGNNCYQIDAIEHVFKTYTDMKFILCHLSAPQKDTHELFIDTMKRFALPNVYFDIAALPNNLKEDYPFPNAQKHLREACDIVGSDKILWGSDFPAAMCAYPYEYAYRYIEESNLLTQEEKENILYKNAKRIFQELL